MPGGQSVPDDPEFRSIPGAAPGVVAMRLHTFEGLKRERICEECEQPIQHPSDYWGCGAGWLKHRKGKRHPDGMVYWHDQCLK